MPFLRTVKCIICIQRVQVLPFLNTGKCHLMEVKNIKPEDCEFHDGLSKYTKKCEFFKLKPSGE